MEVHLGDRIRATELIADCVEPEEYGTVIGVYAKDHPDGECVTVIWDVWHQELCWWKNTVDVVEEELLLLEVVARAGVSIMQATVTECASILRRQAF